MSTSTADRGQSRNVELLLRRFAVLVAFRDDDARRLLASGEHFELAAGEQLYEIGGAAERVYLVLEGTIALQSIPRGTTEPVELRRLGAGEALGLEAAFGARRRHARAVATAPTTVLEINAESVARAVRRAASGDAGRLERAVRRQLIDERLRTIAFTRDLAESERDLLLDMVRQRSVEPGTTIYRQGQRADAMMLIASGMVRLGTHVDGDMHIRAYLSAGDFFGEQEVLANEPRRLVAQAVSTCDLLLIPREHLRTLTARNPGLLERMQRISWQRHDVQADVFAELEGGLQPGEERTRHLIADVYRAAVATELLAIDLDKCVTCGTCAWSCHKTHGQARLVRRGDKVLIPRAVPSLVDAASGRTDITGKGGDEVVLADGTRLLLPNSCQHCRDPECMVDCPTGAIGRDPHGEVFINPQTCIGCEACAKRCPWDNISMAPATTAAPEGVEQVAVKCDLCRDYDGTAACVSNCPTGAIFRLDPQAESDALRALLDVASTSGEPAQRRGTARAPWLPAALIAAAAAAMSAAGIVGHSRASLTPFDGAGLYSGLVALGAMLALIAYGVRKRAIRLLMRLHKRRSDRSRGGRTAVRLSTWYHLHLVLGAALLGAFFVHSGGNLGGVVTTVLAASAALSVVFGLLGALLYKWVPPRLARVVRSPHLPEDAGRDSAQIDFELRDVLSGRDEAKTRALRVLTPIWTSATASWALLFSGATRHDLRRKLATRLELETMEDADERAALERVLSLTVERVGQRAEHLGQRLLAAWVPPHLVFSAATLGLAIFHAITAMLLVWG